MTAAAPRLVVDLDSGVPPWRQVRDQLLGLIAAGHLTVGAQLPTIRQLATDLGLAAGTVARAYRELETAGVLHTARRRGTLVAAIPAAQSQTALATLAADYATRARALGADLDTALAACRAAYTHQEHRQ